VKNNFKTVSEVLSYLKPIVTHQNKKLDETFIYKIIEKVIINSVKTII
jgi:hypothetical protein